MTQASESVVETIHKFLQRSGKLPQMRPAEVKATEREGTFKHRSTAAPGPFCDVDAITRRLRPEHRFRRQVERLLRIKAGGPLTGAGPADAIATEILICQAMNRRGSRMPDARPQARVKLFLNS